jgi:hypothetical protein
LVKIKERATSCYSHHIITLFQVLAQPKLKVPLTKNSCHNPVTTNATFKHNAPHTGRNSTFTAGFQTVHSL